MKEGIIVLFSKLLDIFQKKSKSGDKQQEIVEKKDKYIFKSCYYNYFNIINYVCFKFFISKVSYFRMVV